MTFPSFFNSKAGNNIISIRDKNIDIRAAIFIINIKVNRKPVKNVTTYYKLKKKIVLAPRTYTIILLDIESYKCARGCIGLN